MERAFPESTGGETDVIRKAGLVKVYRVAVEAPRTRRWNALALRMGGEPVARRLNVQEL